MINFDKITGIFFVLFMNFAIILMITPKILLKENPQSVLQFLNLEHSI